MRVIVPFVADLPRISGTPTRAAADPRLQRSARWGETYAVAVRSCEANGEDLATLVDYPPPIRRFMYTTTTVEGYNRQPRKVTRSKGAIPRVESARKLLYLVNQGITV